jgi:hypothetical protein
MLVLPIQYSWPIDLPMHPKKPGRPQETYQCNIERINYPVQNKPERANRDGEIPPAL